VASAIKKVNEVVDQTNSNVETAYAITNAMAKGKCAGEGIGKPPKPLPHLAADAAGATTT
jgi:hypothetical protein